MNSYDKNDFVFERDSGIEFQHAKPSEQPFKLSKNQFTVIPRLESVKAEEYNKKFEEMRKAMPKNLAYAGKFGKDSVIPPGVSAQKAKPKMQEKTQTKNEPEPKNTAAYPVKETISLPPRNTNKVSPPPVNNTISPPPKKQPEIAAPAKKEPENPPVQDETVVFYTGYESEKDPFNDDTYKNQEFVIDNDNKKSASFRDKLKHTFHKLFSNSAEEETYNYNDE